MTDLAATDDLFFTRTGMDRERVEASVGEALAGMDDGELFLEYSQSKASRSTTAASRAPPSIRARVRPAGGSGEAAGYAHASECRKRRSVGRGDAVRAVASRPCRHAGRRRRPAPTAPLHRDNPSAWSISRPDKAATEIDAYARGKTPRPPGHGLARRASGKRSQIIRPDGTRAVDIRPLVRLNVSYRRRRRRSHGDRLVGRRRPRPPTRATSTRRSGRAQVDEALRQALVNLGSLSAPAGEMTVVLGPGWPGVMLHEAIGHGLEGDFNRKGSSAFAGPSGSASRRPVSP